MSENGIGTILWHDLTVDRADEISAFYQEVVGWKREELSMGTYDDFNMSSKNEPVAGVCHAKGVNTNLPAQWLMYVSVSNLDESLEKCKNLGGQVLGEKRQMGNGSYCLIQDPAGAYMMLCQY